MLDVTLTFLVNKLNAYLKARTSSALGAAIVSRPVEENGKWGIDQDHLGASLINVEEERVLQDQVPEATLVGGQYVVLPPPLKLNLHVLLAANFGKYDQALKYLSHALTFFQANPKFTQTEHPDLDPRIDKLVVELQSLTYEQLNQIWAFIGGKQLPSVVYKVRMIALQDREPEIAVPITGITAEVRR